jgi:Flp pilus assembly protein TadD
LGFFLLLAPTSSILPIARQPIAENRMYLPLAVVVVGAVLGLQAWLGRRALGFTLVLALVAAALTICRNAAYASEVAIWSDTVAKRPGNARAHDNLGLALAKAGRTGEALVHHQAAVRLSPDFAEARNNLGLALVRADRAVEAVPHYVTAVALKPDFFDAWNNLGAAHFALGRGSDAIASYETAIKLRPEHPEAHNNLALALGAAGRFSEAEAHFTAALRFAPASPEVHTNFANLLFQRGRVAEAVTHYEAALRPNPLRPKSTVISASPCCDSAGRRTRAVNSRRRSTSTRPISPPARRCHPSDDQCGRCRKPTKQAILQEVAEEAEKINEGGPVPPSATSACSCKNSEFRNRHSYERSESL